MWYYEQPTGRLYHNDTLAGTGYAGSPQGRNNPDMESVALTGPLPRNTYSIGAPHDSPHTGKYTLNLTPIGSGNMFGRSNFRIHGDSLEHPGTASEGCIILPLSLRRQIWDSDDHQLSVVRTLNLPIRA